MNTLGMPIWANTFAKLLLYGNSILFVVSIFALPVYQAMNPIPNGEVINVIRQATFLIDVVAALLMLRCYWGVAWWILFCTSTAVFGLSFSYSAHGSMADGSIEGRLVFALLCYWDVVVCSFLLWRWHGVGGKHRKSS